MAKKSKNRKNHKGSESFNGLKVYKSNGEKKEQKSNSRKTITIVLMILLILVGLAAIFVLLKPYTQSLFGKSSLSGELAATIDGYPITTAELEEEYARLPAQYQQIISKEYFLSQMIDEHLVLKKGAELQISITEEEAEENVKVFMEENNLTREDLDELLKARNLDYEGLKNLVKSQLLIEKVVVQEVTDKVDVSTEDALEYYNDNADQFKVPELVTAKHILISTQDGTSDKDAEEKANKLFKELEKDGSKFCEYVLLHSSDSGSVAKCGEYTFPRGQMVPEFEERAFSQKIGESSIVKTDYGYHIILTINKTPESLILFKDIQEEIISLLEKQQEQSLYTEFIANLRADAEIVNYVEQEKEAAAKAAEEASEEETKDATESGASGSESAGSEIKVTITQPAKEEEEMAEEPEGQIEDQLAEDKKIAEEQEELAEAVEETVVAEETEAVLEPEDYADDYASCFSEKELKLYGAYWDSSSKKQKESLGDLLLSVQYIECGVQGDYRAQAEECKDAGIEAYPTWVISEAKYMGIYSVEELAAIAGC